jgi:hypothetical protein
LGLCESIRKAKPLVDGWFQQEIGYGFAVGEILRTKNVTLTKAKHITNHSYLFRPPNSNEPKNPSLPSSLPKPTRKRKLPNPFQNLKQYIREPSHEGSNTHAVRSNEEQNSHPISRPLTTQNPNPIILESHGFVEENRIEVNVVENDQIEVGSDDEISTIGADSALLEEFKRALEWRAWRLGDHNLLAESIGPNTLEREEMVLNWLGTRDLAKATRLSVIKSHFLTKLARKKRTEKGVMVEATTEEPLGEFDSNDIRRATAMSLEDTRRGIFGEK